MDRSSRKQAVIIGAGPAGLTAALELVRRTGIHPVVLEKSHAVGGISRTVNYKGNRMDIGGHRFFSKSDRVMNWWLEILPLESTGEAKHFITYHNQSRELSANGTHPVSAERDDRVMLIRNRKSRIYFLRKFFEYPIALSPETLGNLGPIRTLKIGMSYMKSAAFQIRPETSLEHFLINRFGRQLYLTFFKSYTEKVWGVPCHEISAEWGAQRIKGLSIAKAIAHMLKKLRGGSKNLGQKDTETSLIEKFLYPKHGPGQLWETVTEMLTNQGGEVRFGVSVDRILTDGDRVIAVETADESGRRERFPADYVFSTMPIQELARSIDAQVPSNVREVADGLMYRDFITVGMLLKKLRIPNLRDNWIYVQEPDVLVGRIQIFNNWSPYMVADPSKAWVGLEYFCNDTDEMWRKTDQEMIALASEETERIGMIHAADVEDAVVIRVPKTYPAYFGSYGRFGEIREYFDRFDNLFLVGRNGMHKYNNQDHSMLTAMTAVDNIAEGRVDKSNIWSVNTEQDYHEKKESAAAKA
jgi:protoporphyrinogen oxidase